MSDLHVLVTAQGGLGYTLPVVGANGERVGPVDPVLLRYVNRLSDLLFVLARTVNHRAGAAETPW